MARLISLRGTHGSGKSYVMNNFLKSHKAQKMKYGMLGPRLPEAYELQISGTKELTYVIGPYITACGGLDAVQPYENILNLLDKYVGKGNLVFEGLMASGVYGRIGEWMEDYAKNVHVLFLDTPYETCVKRVLKRRHERGNDTEFDPENVLKKFKAVGYVKKRVARDKLFNWRDVSSDDADKVMTAILQGKK
jgi:thymidylate kinase